MNLEHYPLPAGLRIVRDSRGLFVEADRWPGMDGRWRFPARDPREAIDIARRLARRLTHPMADLMTRAWFWQRGGWRRALRFVCLVHHTECFLLADVHPMRLQRPRCPFDGVPMWLEREPR